MPSESDSSDISSASDSSAGGSDVTSTITNLFKECKHHRANIRTERKILAEQARARGEAASSNSIMNSKDHNSPKLQENIAAYDAVLTKFETAILHLQASNPTLLKDLQTRLGFQLQHGHVSFLGDRDADDGSRASGNAIGVNDVDQAARLRDENRLNGLLVSHDGSSGEAALAEPLQIPNGNNNQSSDNENEAISGKAGSDDSYDQEHSNDDDASFAPSTPGEEDDSDNDSDNKGGLSGALVSPGGGDESTMVSGVATGVSSRKFSPSLEFLANLDMESLVAQFHDAIRKCDYAKTYSCICVGVDVNARDDKHKAALQILLEVEGGPDVKLLSLLLDNGADPTIRDETGERKYVYQYPRYNTSNADAEFWNKLHSSNECLSVSAPVFGTVSSHNSHKRGADYLRQRFLHFMEEMERKGSWHILFRRTSLDLKSRTVLHWLVTYLADSMDLIKRVVEIYERFDMPNMLWVEDRDHRTALYIAAWKGNLELVKFFISKCHYFGKPNVLAAEFGYDVLMNHRLYPTKIAPDQQFRVVVIAVLRKHYDIANYLLEFFEDQDILRLLTHLRGSTGEYYYQRDSSCLKYLLRRFDVEFVNGKHFGGFTVLHWAAMHWHDNIVDGKLPSTMSTTTNMKVIEESAKYFKSQGKKSYINTPDPHGRTVLDILNEESASLRKHGQLLKSLEGIPTEQHQEEVRKYQLGADNLEQFALKLREEYGFKSGIQHTSSSEPPEAHYLTESKAFADRVREISQLVQKKGVYAVFGSQTPTHDDSCKTSIWGPQFAALVDRYNNGNTANESADQSNAQTQEDVSDQSNAQTQEGVSDQSNAQTQEDDVSENSDAGSMTTYLNTNMDTIDESVHHSNPKTIEETVHYIKPK